ncbi:alpha/beta fold hydrolase [Massilia terrae]|uniref:Alpha/beta hydrolase n=1 Tax=Massilia terrae TaxID=1811224 RepID=A0ABT2CZ65_9BURK|nr:alpha/beta hydrolase [Massilia terrae]MCS0659266.1 alpha/beta hydrolase [Massilia terrae]
MAEDRRIQTGQGSVLARRWHLADGDAALPPILLFHDSLGSIGLWRNFPEALARATGREVIAYDRLGFGESDARTETLDADFIRTEAEHIVPLLCNALGIDRFVAFGHSVGGGMAVHCAALHPSRCVALVTESAQAFVEERTREGIREARELFRDPAQFAKLERYHGDKTRWALSAWIDTWLSPGFAGWSLDAVLPLVVCPTLVIHGADDEYGSAAHPQRIAAGVSGPSFMDILPGTRHVPHREQEAWVAARVASFLQLV